MKNLKNIYLSVIGNIALIVLAATAIMLIIMFKNLGDTIREMSGNLIKDKLAITEQELNNTFDPIKVELLKTKERAQNGLFLRLPDLESLYIYFQSVIDFSPTISSVLFADEFGDEFMLLKKDSLWYSRVTLKGSDKKNPVIKYWSATENNKRSIVSDSVMRDAYDPRTRPWYKMAIAAPDENQINWTVPYTFYMTGEPGITATQKWRDQNGRITVFAIDVLLSELSEFTANSNVSENGKVFILTEEHDVLGIPKDERFGTLESRRAFGLRKISDLGIPVIDEALMVHTFLGDTVNFTSFSFDNEVYWSGIKYFKLNNKKLIIGVVIPEKDFSKELAATRNLIIGGLILTFFFLLVLLYLFILMKRANSIISLERDKNELLLLNTLPAKVVADLKEKGISEPKKFENVTVCFSDIVGFTQISAQLDPNKIIIELNDIYSAFDEIMNKYGCERIKTIGDAYMAVCGMPEPSPEHAATMILAGKEMLEYIEHRNKPKKIKLKIRIGMHSGVVVGGIVGIKKYIYDIFGDTINTASRMERNSDTMKLNISETTYNLAKDAPQLMEQKITFEPREPVDIKGKGLLRMYFAHFPGNNQIF